VSCFRRKLAANSVAAFSDGTLVATVLIMPGKTFAMRLRCAKPASCCSGRWDSRFVELKGTELVANNGIETSPDDREFYVASTSTHRVYAFSRAKPGAGPVRFAQLKDFGPDNVRLVEDRLITAGLIDDEPALWRESQRMKKGFAARCATSSRSIDPRTMTVREIARG
jgi:hypothetical protein